MVITYIGYGLLILYLLYCIVFCCAMCISIIKENNYNILKYTPLRRDDNEIEITNFHIVNQNNLNPVYEDDCEY